MPTSGTNMMTVGEAAERLGVSIATMRRWDSAGKFKARRHPVNNFRVYRKTDVERLRKKLRAGVHG